MAKILIIEDDLVMIRFYRKLFALEGHRVEAAEGGREGLKRVKTFKPDLILLDIMMPKMHGLEVLERLKAKPETKDIPVIMLTARSFAIEDQQKEDLQISQCLSKPFSPKELLENIEDILYHKAVIDSR